ncbi:MAG: FHA domain-containing protein [Acidobacteria bacterium]|nr:MAG: FHA domain-containing protein [Acidobacteriota bacterium]REK16322.1 MAG: FHA domain-containing protein [Acidobacteriota bacterium]REK44003.1 MAG: FHA domain-containing protein [Acidobacteriota bacterium]
MPEPCLLVNNEHETPLEKGVISIGRASDNVIAFTEDANVSRYHAEIEVRNYGDYWLFDLNSSNGTELNGERLTMDKALFDGDVITIGGVHRIEVVLTPREKEESEEDEEKGPEAADAEDAAEAQDEPAPQKPGFSWLFLLAGMALGLAVISVGVALAIYLGGGFSGCDATAKITKPRNGDILNEASEIEIELDDPSECVAAVIYEVDGKEIARSEQPPFKAMIDPKQFASDSIDHSLKAVLVDDDGTELVNAAEIALNFDTLVTETPTETPSTDLPGGNGETGNGGGQQGSQDSALVTLTDTKSMTERIIPQFSGQGAYVTGNPGFLDAVSKFTNEYAEAGFYERARRYRDVINTEFIQERALDPPLGYLLAMSRSKFKPTNDQQGAGLWKMDNELVLEFNYNGLCGTQTIAGESQSCAAIASSSYLKDMLLKAFGGNSGDIIYVVAAFGMKPLEAAQWRQTLPEDRSDFWRILSSDPRKQENVARFFAASIVAENPGRFGLQDDKPLSLLYRDVMSVPQNDAAR